MEMLRFNLIPEPLRHARRRNQHVRRWVAAIVICLALDCVPVISHWWSRREAERLHHQAAALATEISALRNETKQAGMKSDELYVQIERAKALRSKRAWSAMMAMIGRAMPAPCWLTTLATEPETPEASAPQRKETPIAATAGAGNSGGQTPVAPVIVIEAPRRLKLAGMAREASQPLLFVSALRDAGVFRSVTLERSFRGRGGDEELFQFELVCEW